MPELKALKGVEIKDAKKGLVEAVFATFNEIDHDKDVTLPGAFEDGAKVRISAFGHASWGVSRGASSVPVPPVGKGVIRTTDTEALLEGQFFLETTNGRDTFELVKGMDDLQEWSYGYDTIDSERGEFQGEKVRFLKKQLVYEVSPVMIGAGVGTRTVAVKGQKLLDSDLRVGLESAGREKWGGDDSWVYVDAFDLDQSWAVFSISEKDGESRYLRVAYARGDDGAVTLADDVSEVQRSTTYVPKGLTFSDDADRALASVTAIVSRSEALAALRAKEGRVLSTANRDRLTVLVTSLGEAATALSELLAASDPEKHRKEFMREVARYERLRSGV